MKNFDRFFAAVILIIVLIFIIANAGISLAEKNEENKPYRVEINRLCRQIEREDGIASGEIPDISDCYYVVHIETYRADMDVENYFFDSRYPYMIQEINGTLYRFDHTTQTENASTFRILLNTFLATLSVMIIVVILFLRNQIIKPFYRLVDVPYELSKGNLTVPLEENRSRFFGRFVWGINMLRETIAEQKQRELAMQKEKQTLLLSITHDIKTPLSAIKLYASALLKGLYDDPQKQLEIVGSIREKADEIENFVSGLSHAASEDFLQFDVKNSEFYLSELIDKIYDYYSDKLALNQTAFYIENYNDCILGGDVDRSVEVLQNIMENAIKYGDGQNIRIAFSDEDNCRLVTIKNSGCTLPDTELAHIFDSFWRGSNSQNKSGSGLGLYICRQLMFKMDGDIFAEIKDGEILVTCVFRKM